MTDSADLTFLVDVDGTLCLQLPRVCEYARTEYDLSLAPSDVTRWDHPLPELGEDRHIGHLIHELLDDHPEWFLSDLSPLDGAATALSRLRAAGHTVRIATHRTADTHHITRAWLDDNDIPYDEYVHDVPANKADLDGHVLVDDYHGHVADALAAGKRGVLMNQPYSDPTACDGAHVAGSWTDVLAAFDVAGD